MAKIIPHIWYDREAKEAANFYVSLFENSRVKSISTIHDTPSSDCDILSFELRGLPFASISAGPHFKLNPSISFMVNFDPSQDADAAKNIDTVWNRILENGGTVMMEIQEYPWSKRYGWIADRYGMTWQLMLTNPAGEKRPGIVPSLLFAGKKFWKAEEAMEFYLSVFHDSQRGALVKYGPGDELDRQGAVMFSDFRLLDAWIAAMDGPGEHDFDFNEALSFIVSCKDQAEVDYYWEKLSAVPESEQCGWLKDKFGVSWQIVPEEFETMMKNGSREQLDRLTQAFLPMKKFDVEVLRKVYEGA